MTELSSAAERLIVRMKQAEGNWISVSEGHSHQSALRELESVGFIGYGQNHGRDGYILSYFGLRHEVSSENAA
jgi:hypothetical protein